MSDDGMRHALSELHGMYPGWASELVSAYPHENSIVISPPRWNAMTMCMEIAQLFECTVKIN